MYLLVWYRMITAVAYSLGFASVLYAQSHPSTILSIFGASSISSAIILYAYTPVINLWLKNQLTVDE